LKQEKVATSVRFATLRENCWLVAGPAALPKLSWLGRASQKTTLLVPKDWTPERTLHSKAPTASVYPRLVPFCLVAPP